MTALRPENLFSWQNIAFAQMLQSELPKPGWAVERRKRPVPEKNSLSFWSWNKIKLFWSQYSRIQFSVSAPKFSYVFTTCCSETAGDSLGWPNVLSALAWQSFCSANVPTRRLCTTDEFLILLNLQSKIVLKHLREERPQPHTIQNTNDSNIRVRW